MDDRIFQEDYELMRIMRRVRVAVVWACAVILMVSSFDQCPPCVQMMHVQFGLQREIKV